MNTTFMKRIRKLPLIPVGLLFLLLTGCTVGPNYIRPPIATPPAYRGADDAPVTGADQNSLGDENWATSSMNPSCRN